MCKMKKSESRQLSTEQEAGEPRIGEGRPLVFAAICPTVGVTTEAISLVSAPTLPSPVGGVHGALALSKQAHCLPTWVGASRILSQDRLLAQTASPTPPCPRAPDTGPLWASPLGPSLRSTLHGTRCREIRSRGTNGQAAGRVAGPQYSCLQSR